MRKTWLANLVRGSIAMGIAGAAGCGGADATLPSPTQPAPAPGPTADVQPAQQITDAVVSQACSAFKKLPLTSFAKNSVVEDDCLEIPAGTTITVQQGANLIIIAHSQLKLDNGTKISTTGGVGPTGDKAPTDAISWIPSTPDQNEKIHCACRDTNCRDGWGHCSANGHSDLMGGKGKQGLPGGNVTVVAREIVLGGTVALDVSGGGGGPPGQSGHVDCKWNKLQCSSPAAGNGGTGDPGAAGLANYKAGTTTASASLTTLKASTSPTSSAQTQVVDTNSSLQKAIDDARAAGQSYDNYRGI